MNRVTTTLLSLTLTFFLVLPIWAQDDDEKIKVRIETMEDGKKKVFERTYNNREEMRADQELQELGFQTESDYLETMVITRSNEEEDITIDIDADTDGEKYKVRKVVKDAEGKEKIIEKEYNSREEMEADQEIDVKIRKKGEGYKWQSKDEDVHITIEQDDDGTEKKVTKKVIIEIEETDEDDGKVKKKKKVKVIKDDDSENR